MRKHVVVDVHAVQAGEFCLEEAKKGRTPGPQVVKIGACFFDDGFVDEVVFGYRAHPTDLHTVSLEDAHNLGFESSEHFESVVENWSTFPRLWGDFCQWVVRHSGMEGTFASIAPRLYWCAYNLAQTLVPLDFTLRHHGIQAGLLDLHALDVRSVMTAQSEVARYCGAEGFPTASLREMTSLSGIDVRNWNDPVERARATGRLIHKYLAIQKRLYE